MRFISLIAVALLITACSPSEPAPSQAPEPSEAAADPAHASEAPAPDPAAAPAPAPAPPSIDRPAPPAASGMSVGVLDADAMKELERSPGATPALAQRELSAEGVDRGDLPGAPGPSPTAGPDDALVKVVVFSDFQCPVCRRAAEPVKHLAREFPQDVQIIWKNNALTSHSRAEPAAIAALAAQRQGRFWDYHDRLFQDIRALSDADLLHHARQLELDMERFSADLADPALAAQVAFERALAESLEARGTPAFFVNGQRSVGWGSYAGLRSQVMRALNKAKAAVEAGTPRAEVAVAETRASGDAGAALAARVFSAP